MKAYKGFNKDMTCRGFQYEEGKEYETDTASLCNSGFHACENPLDCFDYYSPSSSVYHEVEIEDNGERGDDSKVVGKKIKIGGRLSVLDVCKLHFEYVKEHTTTENTDSKTANAGDYGSANAGYRGSATSRGASSVGSHGIAVSRGNGCKVKGKLGSLIVIAAEKENNHDITDFKAAIVDGEKVKADTWYELKDGEFVEVSE